jgi:molybdate transport system substrate-binding protein
MIRGSIIFVLFLIVTMTSISGCSDRDDDRSQPGNNDAELSGELSIFAAASLTDAFEELRDELAADYPELEWTLNFAGSSALRTQLEEGAQADVFASANVEQMEDAIEAGRIDGDPLIFVQNRLVLIIPADNPADIESLVDLTEPGTLVVLAQEQVPVGKYSRQSLDAMSHDPEFGEDFKDRVLDNVVSEEPNVRAVVTRVQLGETDAGIVYASDITSDVRDAVLEIEIPDEFNVIAEYPVARVEGSGNPDAAEMFIAFLLSDEGQAILERHGFISIE